MRHGRRVGGHTVVTHAVLRSPNEPIRFGYIASKKVGNAVTRNLITRRLKGISDEIIQSGERGLDVVFRAQPGAATVSFAQLREDVHRQLEHLRSTLVAGDLS